MGVPPSAIILWTAATVDFRSPRLISREVSGITKYGNQRDLERYVPVREPLSNTGEVIGVVIDADVLDPYHGALIGRMVDSQDVMEKVAEYQVAVSFTHVRKGFIREEPEIPTLHDIRARDLVLVDCRRKHFRGIRVLDGDDIQVGLRFGQRRLFVKNRPVIEVTAVLNKAEAIVLACGWSRKQLIDVPAQPSEGPVRGPNVRE